MKISTSAFLLTCMQLFSQGFANNYIACAIESLTSFSTQCAGERRELGHHGENILIDMIPDNCLTEAYNLGVLMNVHIVLTAVPANDESDCPAVGLHALFGENQDDPHKNVFELTDGDVAMALEEAHALGEFPLGQIEDAFIRSKVSLGNTFDMVTNNCSTFALSVMRLLGVELDDELEDFAIVRLMENSNIIMGEIQSSPHYSMLDSGAGRYLRKLVGLSDEELFALLVKQSMRRANSW